MASAPGSGPGGRWFKSSLPDTFIMKKLKTLISKEDIVSRVKELAYNINKDYKNKDLHIIGVLKGSFIFLSDLMRKLNLNPTVDFIMLKSYAGEQSTENVKILHDISMEVKGKDILIVEDIVDTGITLEFLINLLHAKSPNSIKVITLLDKPSKRKINIPVDYVGFKIKDRFVVGYGLDFNEQYRQLPFIGYFE